MQKKMSQQIVDAGKAFEMKPKDEYAACQNQFAALLRTGQPKMQASEAYEILALKAADRIAAVTSKWGAQAADKVQPILLRIAAIEKSL